MPSEGHLYAAAAPSLTTAISVAVAAGESLLTAAVLAIAGIYMTRSGFMGQEVTRGLAALQMRCLMPCLLFSRVLPAVSPRLLVLNWPMLLLPLAMVARVPSWLHGSAQTALSGATLAYFRVGACPAGL